MRWTPGALPSTTEFRVDKRNCRDVEVPMTISFIKNRNHTIGTVLDVGAHWSGNFYAREVRELCRNAVYVGVDPTKADPITKELLDDYIQANYIGYPTIPADLVLCISAIEHTGVDKGCTIPEVPHRTQQLQLFEKICASTKQYLLVTFPYGVEDVLPPHYANIDPILLDDFGGIMDSYGLKRSARFFRNVRPYEGRPYVVVTKMEADTFAMDKENKVVECLCVLAGEKDKPKSILGVG